MRLPQPFIRLPWNFDAAELAEEVRRLPDEAWMAHPSRLDGNSAAALVSRDGRDNDFFQGPMQATRLLDESPKLSRTIASFDMIVGRSRLMKLDAGCKVATHVDFNYHWYSRVRIHIPVITNDQVTFYCGNEQVHMGAGESWIFDSWRRHRVVNKGNDYRVHLVIDTAGSSKFWAEVRRMQSIPPTDWARHCATVDLARAGPPLRCERHNIAPVMAPGEMLELATDLIDDFSAHPANDAATVDRYRRLLLDLCFDWRQLWLQHGSSDAGTPEYRALLERAASHLDADRRSLLTSSNNIGVNPVIVQRILRAALARDDTGAADP